MKHLGRFSDRRKESAYLRSLKGEEKYEALNEIIEKSKHIAFFGGAGVSTESGIPDFRSKDGLYNQHDVRFDRYQPEYLLSSSCLYHEPKVFFEFYRQKMDARHCLPNRAHIKLAQMEEKGKLDGVITQNIDGLHQKAGNRKVFELHGSVHRNYCEKCGKFYTPEFIRDYPGPVPKCECGGRIKPDVVLYEEGLDNDVVSGAVHAISKADLMIVAGTSLTVYPAAGLVRYFRGKHLVLINRDATPMDSECDLVIHDKVGVVLSSLK